MMMDGSKLSCEGVVGDGCGGGRTFYIDGTTLFVYDPITKQSTPLLEGIKNAQSIEKEKCDITITTDKERIVFNLSTFQTCFEALS